VIRQLTLFFLLLAPLVAQAEEIKFPEEELARESVLPIFDRPDSVQNRSVTTAHRFEFGLTGGWTMTDAFFNQISLGGIIAYHFNEVHGVNLMGSERMSGVSNNTDQLNTTKNVAPLNLQYAPAPKYLALVNYQYTAYYGKLSLSKLSVGNLSLFGMVGAGTIGIGDGTFPTLSMGIGQKYYFNRSFALRFDLLVLAYQGPDILASGVNLTNVNTVQPSSAFPKKTIFDTMLTVGGVYLLPGS
jgi:outer membrane beta-barrel protein